MSKNLRYDNIIPLLSGSPNDHRVRLFAHTLDKVARKHNNNILTEGFNLKDPNLNPENFADMMISFNYNNKQIGANDNDIHYEFTQFVIDMAKYHSELDPFTGQRFNIQEFKKCDLYENFLGDDDMFGGSSAEVEEIELQIKRPDEKSINPEVEQRFAEFEKKIQNIEEMLKCGIGQTHNIKNFIKVE